MAEEQQNATRVMPRPAWLTEDWIRAQLQQAEKEWVELMHKSPSDRAAWLRSGGALSKVGFLSIYAATAAIRKTQEDVPMPEPDFSDLYRKAIAKWGMAAQLHQAAEEASEFAVACSHLARGKEAAAELLDEYADLSIMMDQVRYMMGWTGANVDRMIADARLVKLDSLAKLLEADE